MSDRAIVILGFTLLLAAAGGALLVACLRPNLFAALGDTITHLTRTRVGRVVAVLVWAWLGWHFLAR
ncbi:DUF6186 family protein [Nocardia sp. NPDC052112]|uniref:DUF6186 family protein n=1 Tax=Nocardia sp. NPDC052112 TaxID=3155646 RepID=UPI00341F6B5A